MTQRSDRDLLPLILGFAVTMAVVNYYINGNRNLSIVVSLMWSLSAIENYILLRKNNYPLNPIIIVLPLITSLIVILQLNKMTILTNNLYTLVKTVQISLVTIGLFQAREKFIELLKSLWNIVQFFINVEIRFDSNYTLKKDDKWLLIVTCLGSIISTNS